MLLFYTSKLLEPEELPPHPVDKALDTLHQDQLVLHGVVKHEVPCNDHLDWFLLQRSQASWRETIPLRNGIGNQSSQCSNAENKNKF